MHQFLPINLPKNLPESSIPFDIFVNFKGQFICFRKSNTQIERHVLDKLRVQNLSKIYCKKDEIREYYRFIKSSLDQILNDENATENEKIHAIGLQTAAAVNFMSENPSEKDAYVYSKNTTHSLIDLLRNDPGKLEAFIRTDIEEDILFLHSKNVAALAVCMGKKLDAKKESLEYLALAGLFHDIGVAHLPQKLKQVFKLKKEDVSPDDYRDYLKHPQNISLLLSNTDFMPSAVTSMIELHEKSLKEVPSMSMLAQILAISDRFDKLITVQGMTPTEAMKKFNVDEIGKFDLKLIKLLGLVLKIGGLL